MIKIFKKMTKSEIGLALLSCLFVFGQVWTDLKVPDNMAKITQLVKTQGSEMSEIYSAGIMMLVFAVLSMILTFCSGYFGARLAGSFSRTLRSEIFHKVQEFSLQEIDRFSTASLITRSTNDVEQMQNFMSMGFTMIVRTPIIFILAVSKIAGKHWQWTSLTCGAVVIVLAAVVFVIRYAHPKMRLMQTLTDALNLVTREKMTGVRVIRAHNAQAYHEEKFEDCNRNLAENQRKAQTGMALMHPTMKLANNGLTIGIYCAGAFIISSVVGSPSALETFSEMVVFSTYASKLLMAFMSLNMIFMQIPRASVCAERILEVLDTQPAIRDGEKTEGMPGKEGCLEFRNVSFRYPSSSQDILSDISFTVEKGQTLAFIGATGSGKTSLVNLIPRLYDTTSGQVLVDGVDVREYSQEFLRNKIGYAPQRALLFSGTVKSNVSYGSDSAAEEDVRKAVDIAQASEFVMNMDGQTDAGIVRGGLNVSGGQRQRLSIARAVCRKPEFYIFDDTFSALDYRTDKALRAALKNETGGVTTIIVAQRIGTIRDADKIIVIDEGRIAGAGTHEELMMNNEIYREIAYTQLSEEEING